MTYLRPLRLLFKRRPFDRNKYFNGTETSDLNGFVCVVFVILTRLMRSMDSQTMQGVFQKLGAKILENGAIVE